MPSKTELAPLLKEDERACCDATQESAEDRKPPVCVDSWEEELRVADNEDKIASAKAEKARNAFDNGSLWESKLKDWIDDADNADEMARNVADQLVLSEHVVGRLKTNSSQTAEGVEILLCLVKRIFDSVQDIVRLNVTSERPKKRLLYTLKLYIECNTNLDEKKKQDALGCIAPYEKAITAASAAQDDLLKKLLQVLRQADKVAAALGIRDESAEATNDLGLLWQIRDLLNRITGKSKAKEKVDKCGCPSTGTSSDESGEIDPPCGKDILVPGQLLLPIKRPCAQEKTPQQQPPVGSKDYYCELQALFKKASAKLKDFHDALAAAQKERDKALARRNSLEAAKKAADEAKAGK